MAFFSLLRRLYLTIYNWAVFFGWAQVLYFAVSTLKESGHQQVYRAVERPLQLAQTAAVLEIFHGLVGLVRSPITATLPQIGSRLYVTWGILWSFPEVQTHVLVSSLVISWSITEIIRYSFFGVKEMLGFAPPWLLWLRMPNKWNFSFDYFYAALLVLAFYVPGSPHMYQYMLAQRKRALSKSKRE